MSNPMSTTDGFGMTRTAIKSDSTYSTTPSSYFRNELQNKINSEWDYASDLYTIQEEAVLGSGSLSNVDVRINHIALSDVGEKLGDDFKKIIFKEIDHARGIGYKYYFDNNYWITVNSDIYRKATASSTVRRCNNMLRWIDENGNYYQEPCAVEYKIKFNIDGIGSEMVTPGGRITVYCQENNTTRKIDQNQRFLFGNQNHFIAYRVTGDGIRNFVNQQTTDNMSATLLELTMQIHYVNNQTDDVVNGIADKYNFVYTIETSPSSITASIGEQTAVSSFVKYNGKPSNKQVTYTSSNTAIATVNYFGVVTMIANGSCNIICAITDNTAIKSTIPITVVSTAPDSYDIRLSPMTSMILEGNTVVYDIYLYKDGVVQSDTFTYSLDNLVPEANYQFINLGGNNFSIKNIKRFASYPISITCTSGTHSKIVQVLLKGAW